MKKLKLLMLCAALLVASAIGLTACSDPKTNELTFNVPESIDAEVGEYFALPSIVAEDSNGDIYPLQISVTDPNEDDVIIENDQIFVDYIGEYKAVYTVTFDGETISKTMKIDSKDTTKPTIALDSLEVYELSGTQDYVVPVPDYDDNYTPAAELVTSVTVKFGDREIDPVDGKIALADVGEYTVNYTAADTSGNTAKETLTIHSFAGEADAVTYFDRSFGDDNITMLSGVGSVSSAQDVTAPGDEYSLKFSAGANDTGFGGLYINRPYIKDITSYEYLYFYVYTDTADVGVTFNAIYSAHRLNVGVWNKIVLKKTAAEGDKIDYVTPWGTKVFYDDYSGTWTADPTDITRFLIWLYIPATGANVWFSSIKGANSMPESEVALEEVCTDPLGTIDIPTGTIAGEDNVTQKVYAEKEGVLTEVTENTYTFDGAGAYKFYFYLMVDGKLADVIEKTVLAIESEADNLTYFNREFAAQNVSHNGMTGKSVSSGEKTIPGEDYALKHTNNSATGSSCIVVDKAYKKDVREFKYLYFYIWIDKANSGVTFNGIWSPDRSLVPGAWNRIVLTRNADSTNYTTPWGTDVFNTAVTPENMDGFMFFIYHPAGTDTAMYLSAMRGTNEELPEAEVELADTAEKDVPFAIPTATGVADVSQKVYLIQGNTVTDISEEEAYTFTENGVYALAFEVYSAGKLVNTVQKTVFVFDEEPGNITYFNQSFGASSVGALNSVGAGISTKEYMTGDASSLECYLQAPGYWPSLKLVNPFVKNLNEKDSNDNYLYNYVVFYAYTTDALKTRINIGAASVGEFIPAGVWTRIVLVRDGETFLYNGTNVFNETITANDISGLQIVFDTEKETAAGTMFLSTFRAVKEIEQPEIEIAFDEYYFEGAEINVTATAEAGYVVKAYYEGEEYTSATFVAENAGAYDFIYRVFKDDVLYATYTKTVMVVGNEADNLTYFNHEFGAQNVSHNGITTGKSVSSNEKTIPGEDYALKHTNNSATGNSCIVVDKAYKKDITEYKYLYFYIWINRANSGVTFNGIWSPDRSLVPGAWNRIVLTRNADGTNYTTPWGTNVFNKDVSPTVPTDMDGFMFFIYQPVNEDTTIYLSSMRGTNEEFPEAEVELADTAEKGVPFAIPTATGVADVSQKVYLIQGSTVTEIKGSEYTFTENGVYALAFEVYSAGKLVNTVQKTVFVYDEEPGNITYFNQSFGASSVGALNSVGAGISTKEYMTGDASSLECYLQAPGYWPSLKLVNPFVKNLNEKDSSDNYLYDYVVFYAYTTDALKTRINIGAASVGEFIPAGVWTRIVLVRDGETFLYNGTNVFNETITANDISGLQIVFDTEKETIAGTMFLSTFRAVKEIEQPEIEIAFDEYYFEGAEINVTATAEAGYVVKTYHEGEEYTSATFVAENAGAYDFIYRVFKDDVLYATYTKTVMVVGNEADNLTYFNRDFGKDFAVEYNSDTSIAPSQNKTYGDEEYSLEISAPTPYWGVGGVYLRPAINDITPYKYMYFYVYTDITGLTFYGTSTAVPAGVWTKVVMVRQADNSFISQSFVGNKLTISAARAADMNAASADGNPMFGILLISQGDALGTPGTFSGVAFCISAVRVTNTLAEENAVLNLSTSQGAAELGSVNSLVFGPSKVQSMAGEECSTEFYLQAPGYQPTVKLTAPAIANLNAKDAEDNYLYDYVYFYAYSGSSATSLTVHYATGEILPANTWKMLVLERQGDTFFYNGADVFGTDGVTAEDITNLQLCFNTVGESNYTSVYMTSWRAVKTLPQQ